MQRVIAFSDGAGFLLTEDSGSTRNTFVTRLDGWFDGTEVSTNRTERIGDGTFRAPTRRTGRKLTLTVVQECASTEAAVAAARAVSGAFRSGVGDGTLVIADEWDTLTAEHLQIDGNVKVALERDNHFVEWEIPLFAPDPYLYGPQQSTTVHSPGAGVGLVWDLFADDVLDWGSALPGGVELVNLGNQPAYPVAVVHGDMPSGFRLDVHGALTGVTSVTFAGHVSLNSPCVVDFAAGRVTNGGSDQSYLLTSRHWGGVLPGGTATATLAPLSQGYGWADLNLRSTYA